MYTLYCTNQFATFRATIHKPGLSGGLYGARAYISVYNPPVKMYQVSMAQLWIEAGPPNLLNSIQFGWAVSISNFIYT